MRIPIASMGLAAIIIQDAVIRPSEKKDLASLIFLLFRVDRYLYVTKKLAELTIEAFIAKNTPKSPMSVLPIAVKRVLAEKGVTIAQPGSRSFAFLSIEYTKFSSLVNLLYKVFWCLAANSLHLHASLENFNCLQLDIIRCWVEAPANILLNFCSKELDDNHLKSLYKLKGDDKK